ncbi:unnamed protein product [Oncorhynchus mykiss]|uniref:Uncharacterized protein n=1 Tax=Oncorhynchus mykiss TaxID=8022 RepID=A0A060YIP5_ONCMY|nr:unnamed protein product [Oncorhynchus mykiss]
MLFSLALLFLLTPFPSLQTPVTNEKRNAKGTGSEPKPYVLLTLSLAKPKTAATLVNVTKETPKPTLKALNPTAANQTHPAPSSPLKPPTATLVKLTKETPKPTVKALSPTVANQTHPAPSTPLKPPTATLVKLTKETPKPTLKAISPAATNQTHPAPSTPLKPPTASGPKTTTKDKPSITLPHPIPIKVLITSDSGCISKDTQSDVSNRTKEQTQTHELKLKPGFPLTLTHRISLVPTSCTGGCVAEMAALKGRVGRLEKEMSLMKSKCTTGPCPNDCSANGKCEKGKCVCLPGFLGLDCSKCTAGADCSKSQLLTKAGTGKITLTKDIKTEADISSGTSKTTVKTGSGKGKPSQYVVNMTTVETTSEVKVFSNKTTTIQSSKNTTRKAGTGVGRGLGSVKVQNITTYGFTLTWSAPTAMFKNFTSPNGTVAFPTKAPGSSRGKAHTKRVSVVLPDSVRSVEFSNLRPQTRYSLHICGTTPGSRSKIHRVTTMTGPEPPTELVFSNVTEASLSVSWSKPKNKISGFKITYSHSVTGKALVRVVTKNPMVTLTELRVPLRHCRPVEAAEGRTTHNRTAPAITTSPSSPIKYNYTCTLYTVLLTFQAVIQPKLHPLSLSIVSPTAPNVTVTVMVSGNSVEQQLRGLQRDTLYTVKALSQKDSLQSTAITTTFTTASAVKAGEVGARSAVVSWKSPSVAFSRYRVTYQTAGEEVKFQTSEVILDSTVTEYKLTGLFSMSKYTVLVQGEREGQYTSIVTTEFITGKLRFPFPTECSQELLNGALQSGEVDLYPEGKEGKAVRVYCDMETEGGGWTVFQRRMNGKTDFFRTWSDYTTGFGNLSEEFWLGNELLHNLTSMGPVSLRVDLRSGNDTAYAHYSSFTIDSVDKHYAIEVSGYTGTAGDSMRYHNGRPFSTRDKEPHPLGIHCARAYMGGWWYKNCYKTNLNGLYGTNSNNQGVVWIDWKGKDSSIPFTEMKFRPAGISITTHG